MFEAWERSLHACAPCLAGLGPQPALPSHAPLRHSDTLGFGAHGAHANGHATLGKAPTLQKMPTGHLAHPSPITEEPDGSLESGKTSSTTNGAHHGGYAA